MRGQTRDLVILGSTGSIGTQALEIVRANPDRFRVVGLTAGGSNRELFDAQVAEFSPAYSGLGEEASVEAAALECDVVLNGITGAVGLRPTLAALDAGNTLALEEVRLRAAGGQGDDPEPVGVGADDVERLGADGARRPQHHDVPAAGHRTILPD